MSEINNRLKRHMIPGIRASMYYIPNFITEEEEATILRKIPSNRWITLTHRRLQALPSRLTSTNTLLTSPLPSWLAEPLCPRISDTGIFAASPHGINHCLINEYLPGQGIMPHVDGAAYHPVVATVSLGGTVVLDVTSMPQREADGHEADPDLVESSKGKQQHWRILQEPRSLLVTVDSAYMSTLHGIAEVNVDRELGAETVANWDLLSEQGREAIIAGGGRNERTTRISLTFRDVKKVSIAGAKIFGKPKG